MEKIVCPYCNSERVIKRGFNSKKQKWECKDCEAIFSSYVDEKTKKEVDIAVTKILDDKLKGEKNDKI
jgi:transposase-like protein